MERIVFALILLLVASCADKWLECRQTTVEMMEIHSTSRRIAEENASLMNRLVSIPGMDNDGKYIEMVEFLKKEFLHFTSRSIEYLTKARANEKKCNDILEKDGRQP